MKTNYYPPRLRVIAVVIDAGFVVSTNMDDDSQIDNLEWD
jgi:hypothetical protein